MTIQPKNKEGISELNDLTKFFQNKYIILIFISQRNKSGPFFIVPDIMDEFDAKEKQGYKLVRKLESEGSIKKGPKIKKNGILYYTYTLTETAKIELRKVVQIIKDSL